MNTKFSTRLSSFLFLSFLFLILGSSSALADFRIATVDLNKVINNSKEAKDKRAEMEGLANKAKAKIEEKKSTIVALQQKAKAGKIAPGSKEAEEANLKMREYERLIKDSDEDLKGKFVKVNNSLTQKALAIISKYAAKNNLGLVLNRGEKTRGPLLLSSPSADITDDIIKQMNS